MISTQASTTQGAKYITITLDHTRINSDLVNFPIQVHLSRNSGTTGADLTDVFTTLGNDANRTRIAVKPRGNASECYVEIEKWNTTSRDAVLWVKVPTYSHTTDTILYLYYDPSMAPSSYVGDTGSTAAQKVWDNDFTLVLHLNQAGRGISGEYKDSTSKHHDATGGGSLAGTTPATTAGKIGNGLRMNGIYDYIQVPDSDDFSITNTNVMTISMWAKADSWNMTVNGGTEIGFIRLAGKENADDNEEWELTYYDCARDPHDSRYNRLGDYVYGPNGGLGGGDDVKPGVKVGEWRYYTWTFWTTDATSRDGKSDVIMNTVGGPEETSTSDDPWGRYVPEYVNGNAPVRFGQAYPGGGAWNGGMDEIRMSSVVRSHDWINASYYSDTDQLAKYAISSSTPVPKPTPKATPTVTPTATPSIRPTATPTTMPTATPPVKKPTVKPTATPKPSPSKVVIFGSATGITTTAARTGMATASEPKSTTRTPLMIMFR